MLSSDKNAMGLKTRNVLCFLNLHEFCVQLCALDFSLQLNKSCFPVFKVSTGWQHFIPPLGDSGGKPPHFGAATLVKVIVLQSPSVSNNCSESEFIYC